jgi:chemotaxis protein histidine kinase CheA
MAKSRFSSMVEDYGELTQGLRDLRQHWRQMRRALEPCDPGQETTLQAMDEAFVQYTRRIRRFGNEMRYEQDRSAIALNDIRDQILGLMLRPLDSIFSAFPRAVRDTAVREHKKVRLQIAGKSVEMDQGVAEALVEPLIHLLNNAIAHGIETPEERRQAGKPEEGMISILAEQSGNEVHIEVVDDGRGIDIDRIRDVAIQQGVTTQHEATQMDSAEILEMIFRPGFSTHADVDHMAGRGMGMNVVQDTVRRLTGSVRIHTEKGLGTCFSLSLPASITVQRSLQFRIGDHRFGMLTHLIEQVVPLDQLEPLLLGDHDKGTAARHVRYAGKPLPLVDLRHVLERRTGVSISEPHVIIAKHIEGFVGIVVDELLEESEIIVRDIDPYLKRYQAPGLMGNSIVSDGQVLLLIEPYGIKEMGRTAPAMVVQAQYLTDTDMAPDTEAGPRVLLVEDSLIAREVEKKMLQEAGFSVRTAVDGADALEKARAESFALIVTDLEMPRLDGFGLVRQMRNESAFARMPILVISTRDSEEDRLRAREAGADAYLVKQQLSREGLADILHGLLHR